MHAEKIRLLVADFFVEVVSHLPGYQLFIDPAHRAFLYSGHADVRASLRVEATFPQKNGSPLFQSQPQWSYQKPWAIYQGPNNELQWWVLDQDKQPIACLQEKAENHFVLYLAGYWEGQRGKFIEPLFFPITTFLWQRLLLAHRGFIVHAACAEFQGKGWVFPAFSGTGKSTLANRIQRAGAHVVHDDRVALRAVNGRFYAFPLPQYPWTAPVALPVDYLGFLAQGKSNSAEALGVSALVEKLFQHSLFQSFKGAGFSQHMDHLLNCAQSVKGFQLALRNDESVPAFVKDLAN